MNPGFSYGVMVAKTDQRGVTMGQNTEEHLKKELSDARKRVAELEHALYEQNQLAKAIAGSEEHYRSLVENAGDVLWIFDLNLGYTYVSPSVRNLRGYRVEEAMEQSIDDILTPESAEKARRLFEQEKLLEINGHHHGPDWSYTTDFEMIHKNGNTFWTEMTMKALYDKKGRIRGIIGITRDISKRKRAEEDLRRHHEILEEMVRERTLELSSVIVQLEKEIAERIQAEEKLRENEEKYHMYFSLSNDVMFSYDDQFRVQDVSPNVEKNLGYKPEELVGRTFDEVNVLNPEYLEKAVENALKILSGETVHSSVYEFITRDGRRVFGEVSGVPVIHNGKVEGEITVARDISEHIAMQRSLKESEERYRITLETMPHAVSIISAYDLSYLYVNNAFCAITGYDREEVIGRALPEIGLHEAPEELDRCVRMVQNRQQADNVEHACRKKDGSAFYSITSARPIRYSNQDCMIMVMTDITILRQVADEKRNLAVKSQKMEAIATLARGIAHDFNNILTTILGYSKMSMKDFVAVMNEDKDLSVVRSDLKEISSAAYRARDLVNHILAFSRHSEGERSPIMLSSTVRESLKILRQSLPAKITIKEDLTDSHCILGDPAQIHLVLENLCTNALYAMDNKGGELKVSVSSVNFDEDAPGTDIPAGSYMRLKVKDTGHGMTPQIMTSIFDPYFTTKKKGQGMGLGLSVVHGIVKSHGGFLSCTSTPGEGTTFDIHLPLYDPDADQKGRETLHAGRGRRILDLDEKPDRKEKGKKGARKKGVPSRNRQQ